MNGHIVFHVRGAKSVGKKRKGRERRERNQDSLTGPRKITRQEEKRKRKEETGQERVQGIRHSLRKINRQEWERRIKVAWDPMLGAPNHQAVRKGKGKDSHG